MITTPVKIKGISLDFVSFSMRKIISKKTGLFYNPVGSSIKMHSRPSSF